MEYRKYLFDNFIVGKKNKNQIADDDDITPNQAATESETVDNVEVETSNVTEVVAETDYSADKSEDVDNEEIITESIDNDINATENVVVYTQDDMDEAVEQAKNQGYSQGLLATQNKETEEQNELLTEIRNQLSLIFASVENQADNLELDALRFLATALRKLMPAIEKADAIPEIKKFLDENFALVSPQKSLAFFFHPDSAKKAAGLVEKIADHNDFEGKIAVHKDESLGLSDCRIEWSGGHIERNTAKLLDKLDELLTNNQKERENG